MKRSALLTTIISLLALAGCDDDATTPACTPGCANNTQTTCNADGSSTLITCFRGCNSATNTCNPDTCVDMCTSDGKLLKCNADGTNSLITCANGCDTTQNRCLNASGCTSDVCSGDNLVKCNLDGTVSIEPCTNGCNKTTNECNVPAGVTCSDGDKKCENNKAYVCSNNSWGDGTDCGNNGCSSSTNECNVPAGVICSDGAKKCDNNKAYVCSNNSWGDGNDCGNNGCSSSTNECNSSNPLACTSSYCLDSTVLMICVNGSILALSCPYGCANNTCKTIECTEDSKKCSGNTVQTCTNGKWVPADTCPHGCSNGECIAEASCTNGDKKCSGSTALTCTNGIWQTNSCKYGCKSGECITPEVVFGNCPAGYNEQCSIIHSGSECYKINGEYNCGDPCTTLNKTSEDCWYDSVSGYIHTKSKCSLGANDRMIAIPYAIEECQYSCSADGKSCGSKLVSDQGNTCTADTRPATCVNGIYSHCNYSNVSAEKCTAVYGKDYECATIDNEVGCYEKCTEPTTKCALNEFSYLLGDEVYETIGYDCTSGHLVENSDYHEICEGGCAKDGKACAPVKYTECSTTENAQCATKYGSNYTCYAVNGESANCVEKCDPTGSAKTKDVCEYDEEYKETDTTHYICTPFEGKTTKGFFKYDDYDMCNKDCAASGDACDEYGIYEEKCETGTPDACIVNNTAIKSCISGTSEVTFCDENTSCQNLTVNGKNKAACVSADDVTNNAVSTIRSSCVAKTASGTTSYTYVTQVVVKGADNKNYWYTTESESCMGTCKDSVETGTPGCQAISALEGTNCDAATDSKKCDNTAGLQCKDGKWTIVGNCTTLAGQNNVCLINGSGKLACAEPCKTENDTKTVCTADPNGDYYTNYKCTKNSGDQKLYWAKSGDTYLCTSGKCESASACAKAIPDEGKSCTVGQYEEKCTNGYVDYCYDGKVDAAKCNANSVCAVITSKNYANCFAASDECKTLNAKSTSCVDEDDYSYEVSSICLAADNGKKYLVDDEIECSNYCAVDGKTCDEDGYYEE